MFSRVRTAIRFFFVGLAVGVLLAPRSGEETRNMLREKADGLLNNVLDAASLGAAGGTGTTAPSAAATADNTDEGDEAPKRTRGNGSRTRTSSSTTAASEAGV